MLTVSKQLAMVSQEQRVVAAAAVSTAIVPQDSALIKAMDEAAEDFGERVRQLKRELEDAQKGADETKTTEAKKNLQNLGPPAPSLWANLVEALARDPSLSVSTKTVLDAQVGLFATEAPQIRICKLRPAATRPCEKFCLCTMTWRCCKQSSGQLIPAPAVGSRVVRPRRGQWKSSYPIGPSCSLCSARRSLL